jgi:hypothetical protein
MNEIDFKNIIEEIEALGRSEKNQLINRLALVLLHLLKWQYQPGLRGKSWELTLREQRRACRRLINDNPSLKSKINGCLHDAYEDAVDETIKETGLDENTFPSFCPYTLDQVMDDGFFPE